MKKNNDGGPAFPVPSVGTGDPRDGMTTGSPGMTLRDWFAGQALAGIMANAKLVSVLAQSKQDPASCAYEMAEFMMEERAKR